MSLAASKENAHLCGHGARRLEQDGAMLIGNCLSPVGCSSSLKVVCAASSDLFCCVSWSACHQGLSGHLFESKCCSIFSLPPWLLKYLFPASLAFLGNLGRHVPPFPHHCSVFSLSRQELACYNCYFTSWISWELKLTHQLLYHFIWIHAGTP